ncbi:hypothetical protein [Bacillus sp. CHD6a]|uniref:hypothetical protein n=1 Tax=Bacillus sp. CHD6a TaxID=1643452 RepID=UPI0006CCA269|nr:hypothetical protein [Bacillus sp. CHD6a]KPB04150.1 hypothetical protein AAV98_12885 [Bacillus sp. CHD6a]
MKKSMLLGLISSIFLLGGCGGMVNQNGSENFTDAPDTAAFKDEFTKDFLVSNKEVKEGFYLFDSATKGYQFHFPVNGFIEKEIYERNGDEFESVSFFDNKLKEENLLMYYRIIYEDSKLSSDIELSLDLLKSKVDFEGEYEEYTINNSTYYYGENISEYEGHKSYLFFTLIKPDGNDKGVSFVAEISCDDISKQCTPDSSHVKDRIKEIMHSFDFE